MPKRDRLLPSQEERASSLFAPRVGSDNWLLQQVDEGVLSCLFAYMKKAGEDELDGMVSIFQVALSLARCAVPL